MGHYGTANATRGSRGYFGQPIGFCLARESVLWRLQIRGAIEYRLASLPPDGLLQLEQR